jgi:hypothetical protein
MLDDCSEPWRLLTAFGAIFFALGFRFMVLRYRELAIAERRIRQATDRAVLEFRNGVSAIRSQDDFPESTEHPTDCETCEVRVVPARSDPPGPLP